MGGATKEYEGGGVVCTAVELLHHTRYRSRKRLRWFESKALFLYVATLPKTGSAFTAAFVK